MNKTESILNEMIQKGFKILDTYKNVQEEIRVKCPNGHIFKKKVRKIVEHPSCPECKKSEVFNLNSFKDYINENNLPYTIISTQPIKNKETKVKIRHDECGYEYEIDGKHFINMGNRCPKCNRTFKSKRMTEFNVNTKSLTHEEFLDKLNSKFDSNEYEILSTYKNSRTPIKVKHKCGYIWEITPSNLLWEDNIVCPKCNHRIKYNKKSLQERIDKCTNGKHEYEILDDEYDSSKTDFVNIKHLKCGYVWKLRPNNFITNNTRCPKCNGGIPLTQKEFEKRIKDLVGDEYTPLDSYKGVNTKIRFKHNICGHIYEAKPGWFFNGRRCPKCSCSGTSKSEQDIIAFIKSFYNDKIIENSRNILSNKKELDIYFPKEKTAIEYDGLYWHSENMLQHRNGMIDGKKYHLDKTLSCKEKNIRLIHIFEDEWLEKTDIVKSKIKHILGYDNNPKIYARKCYIEEINTKYKNEFLDNNHIQGKDNASLSLGLWYPQNDGDILVSVMTFTKPRKSLGQTSTTNYDYELSRFANDINYRVIGSFGKLFKYFKDNYTWNKIITYADIRWTGIVNTSNDIYEKNGFKYSHSSKPNYWYIDPSLYKRFHRYNFRKSNLKNKFPDIYDDNKTEIEIMNEAGYERIFDCGTLVYEYKK